MEDLDVLEDRVREFDPCVPAAGVEELDLHPRPERFDHRVVVPIADSFFATLEKDLLRRRSFATRQEARTAVFDYVEALYNPVRPHSTLDYLSPVEYKKKRGETEKAA